MHTVNDSQKTIVITKALSVILPTPEQTDLLRACLHSDESGQQAWQRWQAKSGGIDTALNSGALGIKSLMPLLHVGGVVEESTQRTYVRSGYLREKLRSNIYRGICQKVLSALERDDISVLVLKGAALAETVFDEPALRHCHDIDLLIEHDDMIRATKSLLALGWTHRKVRFGNANDSLWFEHDSGLPLELHKCLFRIPYYCAPLERIWARSQTKSITNVSSRILSPSDNLLHVCGHASYCRSRDSLRWVTDAWFLIQRHPDLDWELFVESAVQSRIALPIYIILGYLADEMSATVPDKVLDRLRSAAHDTGATGRAAALVGAQSGANGTFENIMRRMNSWHERVQILKWMLFPPPVYFRWLYGVRNPWQLPFYYVLRPFGYVVRWIGRLAKLAPKNRDDQAELTFRG